MKVKKKENLGPKKVSLTKPISPIVFQQGSKDQRESSFEKKEQSGQELPAPEVPMADDDYEDDE